MTNKEVVKALEQIKTYADVHQLDEIDYAISVLKKLEKDGITNPLETDFSKVNSK